MRAVWHARQDGRQGAQAGSFADTAEAAIRAPVPAARCHYDFKKLLAYTRSNVRLTHRNPFVAGRSIAFGLIVGALINGATLETAPAVITGLAKAQGLELGVELPEAMQDGDADASLDDAVLQPGWSYAAARDDAVQINPP